MFETIKQEYLSVNFQFILVDASEKIISSEETIFPALSGTLLTDIHPFFINLILNFKATGNETITFNCVNLDNIIADITLEKKGAETLVIIQDLTKHYQSYKLIAQSRNETAIASELIALKNSELKEREKFKNTFIQNFSHELRNPLTNIISLTHLLGKTNLNQEQLRYLDFIKSSGENLKNMVEDILSISTIEVKKLELKHKEFNLHRLFEFIAFTYSNLAKKQGLIFKLTFSDKIPEYVEGDKSKLLQILSNLIDNAIKYTPKGEIITTVALNKIRGNNINLNFKVSDTGIGIPQKDLDIIFNSFTQLYTNDKKSGVGLGLSIVKGLLTLMGSTINVVSQEEKGSTFSFDLNLKYPVNRKNTSIEKLDYKIPEKFKNAPKLKLLIVEDDETIQTILFKLFADTGCFYVDLISDGADVVPQTIEGNYDLILMDINLPQIQGNVLTKVIREFPLKKISDIPIIGLTGNTRKITKEECLNVGMNDLIIKPFENQELIKVVFKNLQ